MTAKDEFLRLVAIRKDAQVQLVEGIDGPRLLQIDCTEEGAWASKNTGSMHLLKTSDDVRAAFRWLDTGEEPK